MRQLLNKQFFKRQKNNQGFTLIEILVALVLIVLVLSITIPNFTTSSTDLDNDVNSIERAIGFMSDEAALKNAVIRLHFILNKDPQEYAVEYGPSDSFILPSKPEFETQVETKEEEEKKKKETKNLNLKFNKVSEFQDKNTELSNNIKIIGVATAQSTKLQTTGEVSIYTFPTGEKDEALVLVANDEDIISLKVNPFSNKIDRERTSLDKSKDKPSGTEKEIEARQKSIAKDIFEKWKKEK